MYRYSFALLIIVLGITVVIFALGQLIQIQLYADNLFVKYSLILILGLAACFFGIDFLISNKRPAVDDLKLQPATIKIFIECLGVINLITLTIYTVMSYGMSPLIPFTGFDEEKREVLAQQLASLFSFLGNEVEMFLLGRSILAQREIWLSVYILLFLIPTFIFILLLILLARHKKILSKEITRSIYRWSIAYAVICALAIPVLVLDFWHPLGWGRMVAAGLNPYHADKPLEFIKDLPIGDPTIRMMYGPMWAIIYGIVMRLVSGPALLAALIFKIILGSAWIGSLWLVRKLLENYSIWHQSVGIAIIGWLPIGVTQGIAEGHNEVVMVFFVLLWLYLLRKRKRIQASISLAASVMIKYVSAPLFLMDLLHAWFSERTRVRDYILRILIAGLFMLTTLSIFFRSFDFFEFLGQTSQWHFYSPKEAVITLLALFGVGSPHTGRLVRIFFVIIGFSYVIRYMQSPGEERFREAVLGVMVVMLFGISSHIWPWYLIWVIALAAIIPGSVLSRWIIGVALITPFPILVNILYGEIGDYFIFWVPTLFLYAFSVLWVLLVPRRWFPPISKYTTHPSPA